MITSKFVSSTIRDAVIFAVCVVIAINVNNLKFVIGNKKGVKLEICCPNL